MNNFWIWALTIGLAISLGVGIVFIGVWVCEWMEDQYYKYIKKARRNDRK